MFAGLLFSYRVCLFWLLIVSRVISDETLAYYENLAREESRTTRYQNDPSFNGVFRRNGAWLPRIKSMESSHTDKEIMRRESERRRQNIYDGTEYDWDNSFPAMEETPTWPPDFNAWPETPTQPPTQVVSQVQQMIPTQVYQVPASVTPQNGPLYNPPKGVPNTLPQTPIHSGIHSGRWRSPLKVPQSTKPLRLRAGGLDVRNASRVCSPGPPLGVNPLFRNCLIIGDSISLGYLTAVKSQLQGLCQVQHAPFAKASGAVDSRYGLECLPLILSTTALEPTKYDAIVFNFGMHDIDYSKVFPEEFVPLEEYSDNLLKIKDFLLLTGAQVAFALTTPVPMAGRRHRRVVKYNTEARRVMQRDSRVEIVDLYTAVTHICGEPPYNSCSIMKRPKDVHFNPKGNRVLGVLVATTLKRLLSKAKPRGRFSAPKAPELSAREGLASSYFHDDTLYCPDMVTRCPFRATCSEDLLSLTGYGCCMEENAVLCADSWHCCPRGSHCSPDCNFRSCKCLFKSSSPASSNISNVVKTKEVTMKKLKSKSFTGSKFAEKKLTNAEKSGKLVKAAEHKIVSMKHKVGIGGKNGEKNEKENRKHRKMEKMAGNKSRKDQNEKKHKHLHYKTKHKKHSNHMKSQKGKFHDKIDQKHKTKTAKVTKPLSWEETKTEPSLSKHLIKANTTHSKTNYHPSTKQYWVTRINKGLGLTTKRKPSIKFTHAWGKGKHQNLSHKSNGKQNAKPGKNISMKEELKNLIVKYRQDLQAKLKLHSAKTSCGFKGLGMKRQRGKASIRNLHVANNKRYHRLQRRKKLSRTRTRVKPRRKLKHIDGGRPLKSALSTNIVQNPNFTSKEGIVQEMRPENKTTNNLKSFERGTDKIVTDSDFSGSRQTIREKELAKGDISHSKIVSSERTIANNITDKNTMRKLRIKTNIKTSEKQLVMGSNGTSQRAIPEQNNSPRSNNEKGDELRPSSNLHQSNDDFEKNYSAVGSTSQEDQGSSISGAVLVPSDNERADRVTRHPIKNVGSASGLVPLSSLMGEYGGDSGAGSSAEFEDEEESLPDSSDGPEAMFPKTRTSWNRAGRDETGKLEREGIETDGDTSGSGVAQTKRILDESRDAGFVTLSPEMESPRSGPQNLVEQTITGDLFSGSGFHTEPVGDSPPQLSISSQYRDANNVQPSTRRLPMDYNLNVYQNRAERKIGPTPGSHGNSSLSTEGESESGDHGYYDSRNVINFQKHSNEEGSQDSTRPFDQISASKELGSAEGFSTFSSADYGQDLSSSGSGPGKVLVVDTSGVERETTSYGSGLHFGGENDNDKQRASKREDFPFGDSLLCVISPNCKT